MTHDNLGPSFLFSRFSVSCICLGYAMVEAPTLARGVESPNDAHWFHYSISRLYSSNNRALLLVDRGLGGETLESLNKLVAYYVEFRSCIEEEICQ